LAAPDQRVIAIHGSSPDLLYYCNRPGWAIAAGKPQLSARIEECRRQGAGWLVIIDQPGVECERALDRFATAARGDGFRVLSLGGGPSQAGNP